MIRRIRMIRHTRVDVPRGICYGQTDVPVSDEFDKEADRIKTALGPTAGIPVYSSPSLRCRLLAEALSAHPVIDRRIHEIHFGCWESRPWEEIYAQPEGEYWMNHWTTARVPGGESFSDLINRVTAFLQELNDEESIVVTHAGVIRAALCALGLTRPEKSFDIPVAYGQIIRIDQTPGTITWHPID